MPVAYYKGKMFNLPFNMNTFYQMWQITSPVEAQRKIEEQVKNLNIKNAQNLEEQALMLVGPDIYHALIKGYTEKQWGRKATALPASIIKRIPVRFTFDNNYFNDNYQGIPIGGPNQHGLPFLEIRDITPQQVPDEPSRPQQHQHHPRCHSSG